MSATRTVALTAAAWLGLAFASDAAVAPVALPPGQALSVVQWAPYRGYRFRVRWDNRYVSGVTRVSPLVVSAELVSYRTGSGATVMNTPGNIKWEPVTLERGVSQDTAFEDWADKIIRDHVLQRKNVRIELLDRASRPLATYELYNCWVSSHQALSALETGGEPPVEKIVLQCDGWARDKSVP